MIRSRTMTEYLSCRNKLSPFRFHYIEYLTVGNLTHKRGSAIFGHNRVTVAEERQQ